MQDGVIALKFLKPGARTPHPGFSWPAPRGKRPGRWVHARELKPSSNMVDAYLVRDAMRRIQAECYLAELRGDVQRAKGTILAREGRLLQRLPWDKRAAVLFAADCAERVLPVFEAACPTDGRPREAIEAARRWASQGGAPRVARAEALAAHSAARAASASLSATCAARAAASAAATTHAAGHAAAAATYAERAAQAAGERSWQVRRFRHYLRPPKGVR